MVNILAFPGSKKARAVKEQLATSVAEMPRVTSTMDGGFVISPQAANDPLAPAGDWTNQELADLYRVESLLVQANIRISTGRGVTDENDPWFVFCKEDGEVFVHLARINGSYLLDSPGLGDVLEGADFPELIGRFVRQVAARAAPGDNVVTLRPRMLHDQTVRLHPAVMLAALVWSLYLASDDFVGVAHSVEELAARSGGDPLPPAAGHEGVATIAPEFALSHLSEQVRGKEQPSGPASAADRMAPLADGMKTAPGEARMAPAASAAPSALAQSVAASLAVVAVSYGFYHMPDDGDQDAGATPSADPAGKASPPPAVAEEARAEHAPTDSAPAAVEVHEPAPKLVSHQVKPFDPAMVSPVLKTAITDEIRHIQDGFSADIQAMALSEAAPADVPVKRAASVAAVSQGATTDSVTLTSTGKEEAASVTETQTLLKLVSQYLGLVSDYKVGNLQVSATIDVANIDKVLAHLNGSVESSGDVDDGSGVVVMEVASSITITAEASLDGASTSTSLVTTDPATTSKTTTAPTSPPPPSFGQTYAYYDDKAKNFVSHFIQEAGDIELVQFNSEIVLVDMTAIDEKTDHAYARSWVTDDGHVISTLGHLQDFIDFGMA